MDQSDPSPGWSAIRWTDGGVVLLDQRKLPSEETYLTLPTTEEVARAIEDMVVRGAPAIGCTAALGVAQAARDAAGETAGELARALEPVFDRLAATRPTAVNLFWALGRMREVLEAAPPTAPAAELRRQLLDAALSILEDDQLRCRAIGQAGLELVPDKARILTHCNAGALATGGYGTALGVVRAAADAGRGPTVFADETRPFFQGARLTAWELQRDGIPVTVIPDNAAAHLMRRGEVDLVVVGADRIAANGDAANKIGTYALAVLAREHAIPFYVAAPLSTVDLDTPDGDAIPIEERSRDEMVRVGDRAVVPDGVPVRHPAFDVTPSGLIAAIVTEAGIARPDYTQSLRELASRLP
ncbi:MAG: S-methyl-5-thioribose-1-phosphate isomerase [Myxococcota bacterium]